MKIIDRASAPVKESVSRRGFLQRSALGFAAAVAITPAGALLNVSEATVLRDWRAAKAWLSRELRQAS